MSSPFQIDSDDVARLTERDLPRIMNRLIRAEASILNVPFMNVETTLRIHDKDQGIDARIQAGDASSRWLPGGLSVWQYKAVGKPSKSALQKELRKQGVRDALIAGGTYCLILTADPTPQRLETIKGWLDEAVREVLSKPSQPGQSPEPEPIQPRDRYRLFVASDIAEWATVRPIVLFDFGRPVTGLWPLDSWLRGHGQHQIQFHPDVPRSDIITAIRQAFTSVDGPIHARIRGQAGVGKTRLALETFHEAPDAVLYAPYPPTDRAFFTWMANHPAARAIVIVDECDSAHAAQLGELAQMSERRLRLITIGHSPIPLTGPSVYHLDPLDEDTMRGVIRDAASTISDDQVRFIARIARGYVKLATALAEQVARGVVVATELTSALDVHDILTKLLPAEGDRAAMSGLALLTRVGWDDEIANEGQALAAFIRIPWAQMRHTIAQMERRGLVVRQGRYRYVTPELLALWLAGDVWRGRARDLPALLEALPSPQSRDALVARLSSLAGLPEVAEIIDSQMGPGGPFDRLASLNSDRAAEVFAVLAKGRPQTALAALERVFGPATREDLLSFKEGRRHLVWTLQRLAWRKETFFGAARLLRRLAEAENETWGNNATGIWASLFLTCLGGTEVPALERYPLVEEAFDNGAGDTRKLALAAIEAALTVREIGAPMSEEGSGYVPPQAWHPRTWGEDWEYRRAMLRLLDRALADADERISSEARRVFLKSARNVVKLGLATEVVPRFEELPVQDDRQRRETWEQIREVLGFEAGYLIEEQRRRLQERADQLLGQTLRDRLRRYVGKVVIVDWPGKHAPEEKKQQYLAACLADEVIAEPEVLHGELAWLMSGEAETVWPFGRRLGYLDADHRYLDDLVGAAQAGPDPRLLSAYLQGRAEAGEAEWREALLDAWAQDPPRAPLVLDATWRGEATSRGAMRLSNLVDRGYLEPGSLGRLVWGGWVRPLAAPDVHALLTRIIRDEATHATESGLALLMQWAGEHGEALPRLLLPIAWALIERPPAADNTMLDHSWAEVARILLSHNPVRVVRAILRWVPSDEFRSTDERLTVLKDALTQDAPKVWPVVANAMLKDVRVGYILQWWSLEADPLANVDPAFLLAWARDEPAKRASRLAELVKPQEPITPLVRELLAEYGPASKVAAILAGNFESGVRWGGETKRLEEELEVARGWLNDPEPNVRAWANRVISAIEERLPRVRMLEEEKV